jgi:hypothetical protein
MQLRGFCSRLLYYSLYIIFHRRPVRLGASFVQQWGAPCNLKLDALPLSLTPLFGVLKKGHVVVTIGWDCVSVELGLQRALFLSLRRYMSEHGAAVEWYWQGKTEGLGKNCPSATLSTTNRTLMWARARAAAVRSRRLTAWAMARPRRGLSFVQTSEHWEMRKSHCREVYEVLSSYAL